MSISEAFFNVDAAQDTLLSDLKDVVRQHSNNHPRGQQRTLGPSEVGHPCLRKLAQSLLFGSGQTMNGGTINPPGDPLPSYIGTAAHARFEEAVQQDNTRREAAGQPSRWISEKKVVVRGDLSGTCDLFDMDTNTVIDLKFPGTTAMNEYKRNGPSAEYRTQAHLYGAGYRNEGYDVQRVGIWFLPRAGQLASSYLWVEDYDQSVVDHALGRIDLALMVIDDLRVDQHPEHLGLIPRTAHHCAWCPYFSPVQHGDPTACSGEASW